MTKGLIVYINTNETPLEFKKILKPLIIQNHIYIKKGWQNGKHLVLYGIKTNELDSIKDTIDIVLKKYPSKIYDKSNYIQIYSKINNKFFQDKFEISEVYQNIVKVEEEFKVSTFENHNQKEFYLDLCKKIDKFFIDFYFEKNNIEELIKLILHFSIQFNSYWKENYEHNDQLFNPYNSHLSHFTGFINSLNEKEVSSVFNEFERRYKPYLPIENNLFSSFIETFHVLKNMNEYNQINFFSPQKLSDILINIEAEKISKGHSSLYNDEDLLKKIYSNIPSTFNRWFLNSFYEKLLLMNINIKEKYFFNYCIARHHFEDELRSRLNGIR